MYAQRLFIIYERIQGQLKYYEARLILDFDGGDDIFESKIRNNESILKKKDEIKG